MHVKWFFTIVGIFLVIIMLAGIYFVGDMLSKQNNENSQKQMEQSNRNFEKAMNISKAQYLEQLDRQSGNFNQSILIHDALFNNITDIKKGLDPIFKIIPNATQAEEDRRLHYNQTAEEITVIRDLGHILDSMGNNTEIAEQNKQERELLFSMNKTLTGFLNDIPESFPGNIR